jgi:hypothetical protein
MNSGVHPEIMKMARPSERALQVGGLFSEQCGENRRFGFFILGRRSASKKKNPKRRFSPHSKSRCSHKMGC